MKSKLKNGVAHHSGTVLPESYELIPKYIRDQFDTYERVTIRQAMMEIEIKVVQGPKYEGPLLEYFLQHFDHLDAESTEELILGASHGIPCEVLMPKGRPIRFEGTKLASRHS